METKSKCRSCGDMRIPSQFVYSNKVNKSCIKCRDKRQRYRIKKPLEKPLYNEAPFDEPLDIKFIRHQKLFKKLNSQFMSYAYESVHIYDMRYALVDIRDCLSISNERQYSFSV